MVGTALDASRPMSRLTAPATSIGDGTR